MTAPADLTILLGPQTTAGQALNTVIRENRHRLSDAGLSTFPARLATPLLRRAYDERPHDVRIKEFETSTQRRPAFLSAVNFLGPPHAGLAQSELFPDAELALAGLAEVAPKARLIMAIDPLPAFFLAAGSSALEARVQSTPWEILYELSWADLIRAVTDTLPEAKLLILTTRGVGETHGTVLQRLFGEYASHIAPPTGLLRYLITETGRAVLDRLEAQSAPDANTLEEIYASFALTAQPALVSEKLGIDKVTGLLLDQRFEEDLDAIRAMPRVEVI